MEVDALMPGHDRKPRSPLKGLDEAPEYRDRLIHNASFLTPEDLYGVYQSRLRQLFHPDAEGVDPYFLGANLTEAIATYIIGVQDSIAGLSLRVSDQEKQGKGNNDDNSEERQTGPSGAKPGSNGPESPWQNPGLKTRFYSCDGVFEPDGDFMKACANNPRARTHPSHSTYACPGDPRCLIRVLYDMKATVPSQRSKAGEIPSPGQMDVIHFMVTSRPISDFFEKRLGLDAGASRILKFGKPFRSVIRNIQHLKDHLSSLAVKYDSDSDVKLEEAQSVNQQNLEDDSSQQPDGRAASPVFPGTPQDKEETYNQPEAIQHFRYFVEFIDEYLAEKTDTFRALRDGTKDKVAFEDLWMLFDTGGKIYSPLRQNITIVHNDMSSYSSSDSGTDNGEDVHVTRRRYAPQAYRVLATSGGSPLMKNWAAKDADVGDGHFANDALLRFFLGRTTEATALQGQQSQSQAKQRMKGRYSSLHVICMHVDFDGLKYGTETDMFTFKPFDGETSIKSLEAYPLLYAVSPRTDYLLRRGRKFVDVTMSSKHMTHSGFTVGEHKEEVSAMP